MQSRYLIVGASGLLAISLAIMWRYDSYMLQCAVSLWVVSDQVEAADAVVILGGNSRDRPPVAAELLKKGLVNKILVDTDDDNKALTTLNVPPHSIKYFGKGLLNTYEETCALVHWAKRKQLKKLIIATEPLSSRRLSWIVKREFVRSGTAVEIVTLPDPAMTNWWRSATERALFQSEISKYLYYQVRYLFSKCGA